MTVTAFATVAFLVVHLKQGFQLRYHAGPKRQACFPDDCKFRVPGM